MKIIQLTLTKDNNNSVEIVKNGKIYIVYFSIHNNEIKITAIKPFSHKCVTASFIKELENLPKNIYDLVKIIIGDK